MEWGDQWPTWHSINPSKWMSPTRVTWPWLSPAWKPYYTKTRQDNRFVCKLNCKAVCVLKRLSITSWKCIGDRIYRPAFSWSWHKLNVSAQLHASAALNQGEWPKVPTGDRPMSFWPWHKLNVNAHLRAPAALTKEEWPKVPTGDRPLSSWPWHKLDVSAQLRAPAALTQGELPKVPTGDRPVFLTLTQVGRECSVTRFCGFNPRRMAQGTHWRQTHVFLTLTQVESECSVTRPCGFKPRRMTQGTHWKQTHVFLTLTQVGRECSVMRPCGFNPRRMAWVWPTAGEGDMEKKTIPETAETRTPTDRSPSPQPIAIPTALHRNRYLPLCVHPFCKCLLSSSSSNLPNGTEFSAAQVIYIPSHYPSSIK
jgi:hypothetical protein